MRKAGGDSGYRHGTAFPGTAQGSPFPWDPVLNAHQSSDGPVLRQP